MPDISMCRNETCPIKNTCYRYTATPNKYQSFSSFKYENGKCDYWWDNKEYKK